MPSPVAVLQGSKVMLARMRREDLEAIVAPFSNLELTTYLSGQGLTSSEAEQTEWLEHNLKNTATQVHFGIYTLDGQLIGGVTLRDINHRHATAELGIALYLPEHWGGGYGSEATQLMCQYGAFHLGLHNILLKVFAFNERAICAYKKVGFKELGRRREALRLGQERFDEVMMELLTAELDTRMLREQIQQLKPLN